MLHPKSFFSGLIQVANPMHPDVVTEILKDGDGRISGIKRGEISLSDDDYYLADTQEPYSFRQVTWEDILNDLSES